MLFRSLFHEEFTELGVDRRRLSADADMVAVLVGHLYEVLDGRLYSGVPLVEVPHLAEYVGISVASHGELGQVVGSDGEPVAVLAEFLGHEDVDGDFGHEVQLEVESAPEAYGLHHGGDLLDLVDGPDERQHDVDVFHAHSITFCRSYSSKSSVMSCLIFFRHSEHKINFVKK